MLYIYVIKFIRILKLIANVVQTKAKPCQDRILNAKHLQGTCKNKYVEGNLK